MSAVYGVFLAVHSKCTGCVFFLASTDNEVTRELSAIHSNVYSG